MLTCQRVQREKHVDIWTCQDVMTREPEDASTYCLSHPGGMCGECPGLEGEHE